MKKSNHPDFRQMLPSQVKKYVTAYFIRRIQNASTRFGVMHTTFRLADALGAFHDVSGGHFLNSQLINECYEEALDQLRTISSVMES